MIRARQFFNYNPLVNENNNLKHIYTQTHRMIDTTTSNNTEKDSEHSVELKQLDEDLSCPQNKTIFQKTPVSQQSNFKEFYEKVDECVNNKKTLEVMSNGKVFQFDTNNDAIKEETQEKKSAEKTKVTIPKRKGVKAKNVEIKKRPQKKIKSEESNVNMHQAQVVQKCLRTLQDQKEKEFDLNTEWFDMENFQNLTQLPTLLREKILQFCDVTGFFNEKACFKALKQTIFSGILIKQGRALARHEIKENEKVLAELKKQRIKEGILPLETRLQQEVFEIKQSKIHGIGVFTKKKIPEDTYLYSYEGERIGKCMSDKREREYKANGLTSIYMFMVNDDHIIDATKTGNHARYVNHSCSPNCFSTVCTDTNTVKYFSNRIIEVGEEITIDYISASVLEEHGCNCGSIKCKFNKKRSHK